MAVVQKCVFVLLIALALSDVTRALSYREYLQYKQEMEMQRAQPEQEPAKPPQGGKVRSYLEQLRMEQMMRERQQEIEQAQMEEMEELIADLNLEEVAHQLAIDSLGRLLRPLREYPTTSPIADCVKRSFPVVFAEFGSTASIVYEMCGTGDSFTSNMHILFDGLTTPASETTTPVETTTTAEAETPAAPLCPHHAEEEQAETTTEEPTTTTTEAETTPAETTAAA